MMLLMLGCLLIDGTTGGRLKRVVGGVDVDIERVPHQVSMRVDGFHICGGSLITTRHVLTAAHCLFGLFEPPYDDLTVVTGSKSLKNGGTIHNVLDIKWHDDFEYTKASSWNHDIAIITLLDVVVEDVRQKAIPLPTEDVPSNVTGFVSGFGRTDTRNPYLSPDLKGMNVTVLHGSKCNEFNIGAKILDTQLCGMQPRGVGICKGDSGGPLVYDGNIVGISSWNYPEPCGSGKPDVYTNVYRHLDFIANVTSQKNDS